MFLTSIFPFTFLNFHERQRSDGQCFYSIDVYDDGGNTYVFFLSKELDRENSLDEISNLKLGDKIYIKFNVFRRSNDVGYRISIKDIQKYFE